MKIGIEGEGLYALSVSEIATGLRINENTARRWLDRGLLRLSNRKRTIATTKSADGTRLLFWGEAIDSIYTDENVYWLEPGRGLDMSDARRSPLPPGGAEGKSFQYSAHFEEDRFPATLVSRDPESDYWFWSYISSGDPSYGKMRFTIHVDELARGSGGSQLQVHLYSATDTAGGTRADHHARVRLNGSLVGEGRWAGIQSYALEAALPGSLLREGDNVVEIEGALDTGAPFSIFYVDSIDLVYPHLYRASGPTFVFHADGSRRLTVSGFTEPEVTVLDISDPTRPQRVTTSVDKAADGYTVRFPSSPDGIYAAITGSGWLSPSRISNEHPSNLRAAASGVDYVVIAPDALAEGAQRLAELRRSLGLSSTVVLLEDVIDEFNDGISSPRALRDFLAFAYRHWSRPPRFAVLVGAGDLDYKGLYGLGGNLLPPLMASSPDGLYASDNRFGDVDGDGWPEIIVGRIPVLTEEEMSGYVDKLARFEDSSMSLWSDRVLMVADDDPWHRAPFDRHSESMASVVPKSASVERIYLGEVSAPEARRRLLTDLGSGAVLFNYVGHGGLDRLADEALLVTSDVPHLGNGDRSGIVSAFSCSINRFELPGFTSLGEALTIEPTGGAVAVWAPSGLSEDFEAFRLGDSFFASLYAGEATLGDAIASAFEAYRQGQGAALMPILYNLMGDPALRLK